MKLEDCIFNTRVAVYSHRGRSIGIIIGKLGRNISIKTDEGRTQYNLQPEQLRRLRPKKKKVKKVIERWITISEAGPSQFNYESEEQASLTSNGSPNLAVIKLTGEYEVEE